MLLICLGWVSFASGRNKLPGAAFRPTGWAIAQNVALKHLRAVGKLEGKCGEITVLAGPKPRSFELSSQQFTSVSIWP